MKIIHIILYVFTHSKEQPWDHEDVTCKNTSIKSTEKLITFVQKTVKLLESEVMSNLMSENAVIRLH